MQTKYIIKPQDFVVKINTFNCSNKGHDLVSIQAEILIESNFGMAISSIHVPAGYCKQCNRYYLLSTIFNEHIASLKHALCDFVNETDLDKYLKNRELMANEFASQSILKRCGYSVSRQNTMTRQQRINLLQQIISNEILSRQQIMSFLNWLINFQGRNYAMKDALEEWKHDLHAIGVSNNENIIRVNRISY